MDGPIDAKDEAFWEQFWSEGVQGAQDVFALIPAAEIRSLREEAPSNLATLCYKAVERLVRAADSLCNTAAQQQTVLNCVRLLTRLLPYIFEDSDWRGFFWSSLPGQGANQDEQDSQAENLSLAQSLITALCDLLFCPDFTVSPSRKAGTNDSEKKTSESCIYIANTIDLSQMVFNETEEIVLYGFSKISSSLYCSPRSAAPFCRIFFSYYTMSPSCKGARRNCMRRHALPLFTSLLNVVCGYDPVGYGLPFNHLLFSDAREPLVEVCLQLLIVTLDHDFRSHAGTAAQGGLAAGDSLQDANSLATENLFINYLSRIHREEDFGFVLRGFTRLLNNPLLQTYLPNSAKKVHFHQELLVFFWKLCDYNKKFLFYVLKSSEVLDILVPTLYHLNDARADQSRVGLVHIGVFILLLLSGERNFGVRLNKPYTASVPMDIPVFTGTHADLLVIVRHTLYYCLLQRYDRILMVRVLCHFSVSPYLKTLSMVASTKLLHLLEAFSTPWFLYSNATNHHLVFFLLEIFNNIIQYQFDGNSNLVYTVIRKRNVFHSLANLPTDQSTIQRSLSKRSKTQEGTGSGAGGAGTTVEEHPPLPSVPCSPTGEEAPPLPEQAPPTGTEGGLSATLNASLAATPRIDKMTEKEHAHPPSQSLEALSPEGQPPQQSIAETTRRGSPSSSSEGSDGVEAASSVSARQKPPPLQQRSKSVSSRVPSSEWLPTSDWVQGWKQKLPLQTIMRLLQVLVPQVEKICIDKGLTDESEILKFLQHGTLVGLLPVPHPILIRKYQANSGTTMWFRTYMWGVIYLR
ncbi:conserved hypothetical protein [Ixodes scapularis]|uniref:Protein HID1 n=1 Tax=Ixodes scapularis TaxID=6945 RepID=B7PWG4_IXOSC|nr:conserved hypothetical protein [Ixodes scapularis]|eukprot:XP_002409783.1 conserved hypothetical protein [Ixodes scapularis]